MGIEKTCSYSANCQNEVISGQVIGLHVT